jgi:Phenylpropionate dioxygenase and related ring-hydroxylating dioxygenases, large terminal subunit
MSDSITKSEEGCGANCACGSESSGLLSSPMDRRKFVSLGAYAAAAAALAACAVSNGSGITSPGSVGATVKVSDYAALASVGGVAITTLNGVPVAIVRTASSTFITLSRICPHQGSTIGQISGGFRCPNHLATFNATGTWTGGQQTSNMRSYTTTYDAAAGTLTIG